MISPLQDLLSKCVPRLPESDEEWANAVLRPDLAERLEKRLWEFHAAGEPIDRPEPHFAEEVTPPLGPIFEPFRSLLSRVGTHQDTEIATERWANALITVGLSGMLLLLGQRRTPASLTDMHAIPPTPATLLAAADAPCRAGMVLSVAGRAWAKHAPRSNSKFWGEVSGNDKEKNVLANSLINTILVDVSWWNVFGHYTQETVFEARLPCGHGARWGNGGNVFIGCLEPFLK